MTPTTTSTCPNCGGTVVSGDRFCGSCGTPISPGALAPTPRATVAIAGTTPASGATAVGPFADTSPWAAVATRLQTATLGEFEIFTELGRGGMAAVYLARDLALNRRVAIKVMAPGLLLGPGMVERFRQEAVTVANLQHAHIVSIYSVRQLEDLHFFVMQFVPGRTLEGVLRDSGALSIPVVRAWLYQIGAALGYAHRRGVIHRDVKPGNILLNADGEAIVTDFGIAKVAESPSHTQTGTVVGTPVYMSPEQCYARELTGASDQYSLGVVAYEMLAGRPPFSGTSFAIMRSHTDEPPPPLRDARPDVPEGMDAALMRMLAKRPEDRFATLAEALVALGATPVGPDDPLHAEMQKLAAVTERLEQLADVVRTPASPVPKTRERPKAAIATPASAPATQALIVAVAPPPTDLEPGATATLRVIVRSSTGQPVPGVELRWASSDPSIVAVDGKTGVLEALAPGTAVITASAGAVQDSVDVVVGTPNAGRARAQASNAAATRIASPPRSPRAAPESPREDVAAPPPPAKRADTAKPASKAGAWRWAVPAVAVAGVVAYLVMQPTAAPVQSPPSDAATRLADTTTARAPDSTTAAAPSDSATRTTDSTVAGATGAATAPADSPMRPAPPAAIASRVELRPPRPAAIAPGETVALSAIVRDGAGAVISNLSVDWASSNVRVATVDAARGIVRGVGAGATRITARAGDVSAAVTVSVVPPPADPTVVASLEIGEVRALAVGESVRLTASARSVAGALVSGATIEWSSSNQTIASVTQDGMLTARATGSATVHASSGGRSADRPVTIRPRDVVSAPTTATSRSEADLRNEIEVLLAAYARAIETRDTSLIRRVFPNAGDALMTRWQTTFDDARSNIQMSAGTIELLDPPRDVSGTQVRARASYSARFSSRAARSDQSFPVTFTAVLQRDGGTWRITSIR
jgi:eukaryotic-like serine/threonine-protein kinase